MNTKAAIKAVEMALRRDFFFLFSFLNVQRVNFEPIRGRTDVIHLTKVGVAITTLNDSQVVWDTKQPHLANFKRRESLLVKLPFKQWSRQINKTDDYKATVYCVAPNDFPLTVYWHLLGSLSLCVLFSFRRWSSQWLQHLKVTLRALKLDRETLVPDNSYDEERFAEQIG